MTGGVARGDLEYRISRHSTLGADYRFTYLRLHQGFGNSDISARSASITARNSRRTCNYPRASAARVWRAQSLTEVALDPAIAALLGETEAIQAAYRLNYVPDMQVRLTDTFRQSQFTLAYLNQVIPGNGVYLTSRNNSGNVSYSYTRCAPLEFRR